MSLVEKNLLTQLKLAAVEFPTELCSLLRISESQLTHAVGSIEKPSELELTQKLTHIMHFNEKLAESATGADATIHQHIENELKSVINSLK